MLTCTLNPRRRVKIYKTTFYRIMSKKVMNIFYFSFVDTIQEPCILYDMCYKTNKPAHG